MYRYTKLLILLHIYCNLIQHTTSQSIVVDNSIDNIPSFSLSSHYVNKKSGPQWFIVSGRKVVPGSILKIVVQSLKTGHPDQDTHGTMRAMLNNNDTLVSSKEIQCQPGAMSDILLQVPENVIHGNWTLKLIGKDSHSLISFKETLRLIFTPKFLTILMQTSRPIYNAGQTVHFRIIMLTREFQPYEKPVHVFILDPRERIIKRWPSRQPSIGVISLQFDLPEFPLLGDWIIKVQANSQVQKQTFLVEQYFRPRFEVYVYLPHVFTLSEEFISGTVVANMTNGRHVYGNLTILLQMSDNNNASYSQYSHFENIHQQFIPNFTGVHDFFFSMKRISNNVPSILNRKIIKVVAIVGDAFGWRINEGWAKARLLEPRPKVTFLGENSIFFTPGMPFTVHVMASYDDSHPLEQDDLYLSELRVTFSSSKTSTETFNGAYLMENNGIAEVTAWIPEDAKTLEISAVFSNVEGLLDASSIQGIAQHSPKNRFLHLETSTGEALLGEFIVFHVRNNFFISFINYVVISGGIIISSGQVQAVDMSYPSVTTFSLVASADMTPSANVVVWVIDNDGDVVASSLAIPLNPLTRHEVEVGWNEHKDHSGRSVEVRLNGEIGAYFATYSVWEETFHMNSGHDLSEEKIISQMMAFNEPNSKHVNVSVPHLRRASLRFRDRNQGILKLFPTPMEGPDAHATFSLADAVITTDATIHLYPGRSIDVTQDNSDCNDYELKCLTGGCFFAEKRCDGEFDCYDSSDELACTDQTQAYTISKKISCNNYPHNLFTNNA